MESKFIGSTLKHFGKQLPLQHDGKFVGAVGADISLEQIQKQVSEITPFQKGYAVLVSNNGAFVAHPSAERRAKPLGTSAADTLVKTALSSDTAFSASAGCRRPFTIIGLFHLSR